MNTEPPEAIIPEAIRREIMRRLAQVERDHAVRIVLAVESGSRAWGFASPNSDYDVRFIYARPADWYVAVDLEERRDVIEYEIVDEIDLNGWDVRKALRLFRKSNPALVEWLQSPLVYIETGIFAQGARTLLSSAYSLESGVYHYRSLAKNYRDYLCAEQVRLKKYFYVLRPLLAVRWLEKYATVAPIEFEKLLHLIADHKPLLDAVHDLLAIKRLAPELGLAAPIPVINTFIETELARLAASVPLQVPVRKTPMAELNALFHAVLAESAGGQRVEQSDAQ